MSSKEIERKFLVKSHDYRKEAQKTEGIIQGFLSSVPERTVRVRMVDKIGWITVKGIGNASGTTRFEWEKEISKAEAEALFTLCEAGMIDKTRHVVKSGSHIFEVDEFYGAQEGLVIAEIELEREDEPFVKPKWLGKEVTGDPRYYNSQL